MKFTEIIKRHKKVMKREERRRKYKSKPAVLKYLRKF